MLNLYSGMSRVPGCSVVRWWLVLRLCPIESVRCNLGHPKVRSLLISSWATILPNQLRKR